jgi:hypothetical protein
MAVALAMALVVFALATQRAVSRAEEEMRASDAAFNAGQIELAVRHARRAATLYVPGAGHVDAAYARLRAAAVGAERARDLALAMTAWRAVRAAALESQHVWLPRPRELLDANVNLARLAGPAPAGVGAEFRAAQPGWVVVLALGFASAMAGISLLSLRGMARSRHWLLDRSRLPGLLIGFGVIFFSLALIRA